MTGFLGVVQASTNESVIQDINNTVYVIHTLLTCRPSLTPHIVPLTSTVDFIWKKVKTLKGLEDATVDQMMRYTLHQRDVNVKDNIENLRGSRYYGYMERAMHDLSQIQQPPEDFRQLTIYPNLEVSI